MRLSLRTLERHSTTILISLLLFKILVLCIIVQRFLSCNEFKTDIEPTIKPTTVIKSATKHISKLVTVVIREFELHENDVTLTAHSFMNMFPSMQIMILYDELPYPPLDIMLTNNNTLQNVKFVKLSPSLKAFYTDHYPIDQIKTKYVLFVPDATRITSRQSLQILLNEIGKTPGNIVVAPVKSQRKEIKCLGINMNIREWTLKYSSLKSLECDGISGKHLMLLDLETLKKVSDAFLLPFPHSLYIQTSVLAIKVRIVKGLSFHEGKSILCSHHAQWKQKQIVSNRLKTLYNNFKIKQVIQDSGASEWYGCSKETPRCFGTVLDSMPSYLYEKRWTPPCCLNNLRKTAKHAFTTLDEAGIRYWLEAGSLLGAMRSGDILPWDHDVDIGFMRDDLVRTEWLRKARDRPVVDSKGFLWEKATEGNFYHVHYSKVNKIHVNLFPFYSKNGTMVKDSWFTSHKNMEFPENYLHPMSSIEFVGRNVPSPNNIRDFLELKFGKGAIENPEYPDPSKLKFP